jgi:hypothetical protein
MVMERLVLTPGEDPPKEAPEFLKEENVGRAGLAEGGVGVSGPLGWIPDQ